MNKKLPLYLYGAIISFVGVCLIISDKIPFQSIKLLIGVSFIVAAIVAYMSAFSRQRKQVQFAYHEMHALAMLAYGLSIVLFCNSSEKLINFTAFFFIFYSFSEIIFCSWIFNLAQKVVFNIVAIRAALGLIIGIGTVVGMNFTEFTLPIFGILFILVGTNVILYVPIMKAGHLTAIAPISNRPGDVGAIAPHSAPRELP